MSAGDWLVFAGGGTGGHITQALAVAEVAKTLDPTIRIAMLCSERRIDRIMLSEAVCIDRVIAQPVAPLPGRTLSPIRWLTFYLRWRGSRALAASILNELAPRAVLGLGGFAAGPAVSVAAGRLFTALLNPDAVPGKANLHLSKRSDIIFTAQPAAAEHFPPGLRGRIELTGCPVRAAVRQADRNAALAWFESQGLRPCGRVLGVMGGSLGADTVNQAVCGALAKVQPEALGVIHVCGPGKAGQLRASYQRAGVNALVLEFCERMGDFYAACDLAVTRGGANSVAELAATATPAIIMPYPWHADAHQKLNSLELTDSGGALLLEDRKEAAANSAALAPVLADLLSQPGRLEAMSVAAGRCDRPDAAGKVARRLLDARR